MKIGVVAPFTWFSGHFPERWESDPNVFCLDVDEADYRFLIRLINFRPDVTLFYRPELYPKRFLDEVTGKKIGFLSEPVPKIVNGSFVTSNETDLRLLVYGNMSWSSYDQVYFYDKSKIMSVQKLGWPVSGFRPMPIDLEVYRPDSIADRPIDVFFIGKPTVHRVAQMDFLRTMRVNYRWIAHGVSGRELAEAFRMSKVVLNIHADGLPATEPRIHLAAACGCIVLSERVDGDISPFGDRVIEYDGNLTHELIWRALSYYASAPPASCAGFEQLGTRRFLSECMVRGN